MPNESEVRCVIESWAKAVSAGDRSAILAHHSRDLLMLDFPDVVRGLGSYNRTWDFFYTNPLGSISFVPRDIAVTAGPEVAFASCLVHRE